MRDAGVVPQVKQAGQVRIKRQGTAGGKVWVFGRKPVVVVVREHSVELPGHASLLHQTAARCIVWYVDVCCQAMGRRSGCKAKKACQRGRTLLDKGPER